MTTTPKLFIVYCTIAGFISAWAISGLLVVIDLISGTPAGTFFGVIGTSLGFTDSTAARYVGFALHVLTGLAAGNIFGQIALYWHKITPYNSRHGIATGMIVGMAIWIILFVPLATFGIQPRLDSYSKSAPNQYIYNIANHFQDLYVVIIRSSFVFHIIYGAMMGFISGRVAELRVLAKLKSTASNSLP